MTLLFQWVYKHFLELIYNRETALWFYGAVMFAVPLPVPLVCREVSLCDSKYLSLH